MLLLQYFDIEIKEKWDLFNQVFDHLSHRKGKIDIVPIAEQFS